jgi:putative MATE family efflux protein
MQDLTTGSLSRHLLKTTGFMLVTMVFQTAYFLIDLYWVGRLGKEAVAAVGIAGNLTFIVLALTQMLGVGTTTMVSHAAGRKDRAAAQVIFNQSQVLSFVVGALVLVFGLSLTGWYTAQLAADETTARLAAEYLWWFVPAMALQFTMVAAGAALRGIGDFRTGMIVSTATLIINMVLAPLLIFGWGTGRAYGVAGAAISSLVAIVVGVIWLSAHFFTRKSSLKFVLADWKPRLDVWKQMLSIGLPAGVEFALIAAYLFIVYVISRPFGAAAQAGFQIGSRIGQAGFMPVVALAFAVAPVAGQNFGARKAARVKATFTDASRMAAGAMLAFAILCNAMPETLVGIFSTDPAVIAVGVDFLRIVSWAYVISGVTFVASSIFQAMGNTIPSLVASFIRVMLVAVPSFLLAKLPGFHLHWIWYLSLGSVFVQLGLSLWMLKREYRKRLNFDATVPA